MEGHQRGWGDNEDGGDNNGDGTTGNKAERQRGGDDRDNNEDKGR